MQLPKWVTTEGIFAAIGIVWFVAASFLPQIPQSIPLGLPIPGLGEVNLTPGIFIAVMFVPVVLKVAQDGKLPFVNTIPAKKDDEQP